MQQSAEGRPTAEEIASKIRKDIERGILGPGDRLTPGRQLAKELKVHLMTVQNAYRQLRDEGLILSQQGRGTFVRDPAVPLGDEGGASPAFAALASELSAIRQTLSDLAGRLERLEGLVDDSDAAKPSR
ncbi:GntR family transcriptional regulator [Streptacidiphilus monticola]|uniref:GntR family transcriptional regulator n=1 Tax=Streptacidiphilus monticola TaxID=2161674 RepID=A0ABW1G6C6_9ACTN